MNHKLIFQVADAIETEGENGNFYMSDIQRQCGAPACIIGWTLYAKDGKVKYGKTFGKKRNHLMRQDWYVFCAREAFGLDRGQAESLFTPTSEKEGWDFDCPSVGAPNFITAPHAVATLRHLALTGKVDWRAGYHAANDKEKRYERIHG